MIGSNPITGANAVLLPLRRVKATFANRAGAAETVTLDIPATNDENEAVFSAKDAIATLLRTDPEHIRIGDKEAETYPVFVAPVQDASGSFTLE
jgi:hypothetical protein